MRWDVRAPVRTTTWSRLNKLSTLRRQRRIQNFATLGLVLLGPTLALATFLVLGPFDQSVASGALRLTVLADFIYILVVAALVLQRVAQMISARRAGSAGSQLHLRLTGVFALLTLLPSVLVAVFAVFTLNFGLEGWFSERVRGVVGNSLSAAQAYEAEHRDALTRDTEALSRFLTEARRQSVFLSDGELRQVLTRGQSQVQRGLREAYVIDGVGSIRARGERSYLFDFEQPSTVELVRAGNGETVIIQDWDLNEFRALVRLSGFADRYLYVTRDVDGAILNLLDETQETVVLYNQLEKDRGRLLFEFGLLYIGFALILVLAAVWLGLWFAERLARPIGRLMGAAGRIGQGDLNVKVYEESGNDEIAILGRVFNQMTHELKGQRDTLLERSEQIDRRRRLFDSVLSSVTSGVIGLDTEGRIAFVNRSAERLLDISAEKDHALYLSVVIPEFSALFEQLLENDQDVAQEKVNLLRHGKQESLLVRISNRQTAGDEIEGYVVSFDDVTDLVSAQRMAAWGDVARRIAHEIKNPLTPIQLSAERIKRKFSKQLAPEEVSSLEQYTDVIVRQTNDLRRIVDEFSKFARMPVPERRSHDIVDLVRGAVLLQRNAMPGIEFLTDLPNQKFPADIDATMIGQALTNLIKNAGEAIESLQEKGAPDGHIARISVSLILEDTDMVMSISDNGIGLPGDRTRLFEPYVTTRDKGTGLGLPIVKKIIEEHGGSLTLRDAKPLDASLQIGACAEIRLESAQSATANKKQELAV